MTLLDELFSLAALAPHLPLLSLSGSIPDPSGTQRNRLACTRRFNERTGTPFNELSVPTDIVFLVVLWRLRYKLSLRDLAEMFLERGFVFSHETVRTWEALVAPVLTEQLRARRRGKAGVKWHADETSVKIHGVWCYLYRAIDSDGNLVDSMLSRHRDMDAAKRLFTCSLAVVGHAPEKVTTDGHDAYPRAIRETLGETVRHRCSQYMNNRIEQDQRSIKRRCHPMRGFGNFGSAARFCLAHDEVRDYFRHRTRLNEVVPLRVQREQFRARLAELRGCSRSHRRLVGRIAAVPSTEPAFADPLVLPDLTEPVSEHDPHGSYGPNCLHGPHRAPELDATASSHIEQAFDIPPGYPISSPQLSKPLGRLCGARFRA
jgi:transposase-like protein